MENLIFPLKPAPLLLFPNAVQHTSHALTQVPNLRPTLNFSFFYSSEFVNKSHCFCHHDRALKCPLLSVSTIITPVPATVTSNLDLCNSLGGVTQSKTHRQELLVSSPQQHKNLALKWNTTTSLSIILSSTNNFFHSKTFLIKEGMHWFVLWRKLCISLQSSPSLLLLSLLPLLPT